MHIPTIKCNDGCHVVMCVFPIYTIPFSISSPIVWLEYFKVSCKLHNISLLNNSVFIC